MDFIEFSFRNNRLEILRVCLEHSWPLRGVESLGGGTKGGRRRFWPSRWSSTTQSWTERRWGGSFTGSTSSCAMDHERLRRGALKRHPAPRIVAALILILAACDGPARETEYEILRTFPHDPEAYTQGLLLHEGFLYESVGGWGTSNLRKVNPGTGEVVLQRDLEEEYFGEGLALVDSVLVQLTWQAGVAFLYHVNTFEPLGTFEYEGEGWGLCYDGASLFMSNGTNTLFRRDPATFHVLEEVKVSRDGISVWSVNELECVGDYIWANVFQRNEILKIDKRTGQVRARLDGFPLSLASKRAPNHEAVLNGIAHDAERGTFLVTGKLWPDLFEIRVEG